MTVVTLGRGTRDEAKFVSDLGYPEIRYQIGELTPAS